MVILGYKEGEELNSIRKGYEGVSSYICVVLFSEKQSEHLIVFKSWQLNKYSLNFFTRF